MRKKTPANQPPLRKAKSTSASKVAASSAASGTATAETRGARRRNETRKRLISAAYRLMAEHGMDAVAINQITDAADVGFGSFYNHFPSKEAIHDAVVDMVFEEFGTALDELTKDLTDPAEVISVCTRHTLLRALHDHLWGRFLIREGLSGHALSRGLGMRFLRDVQRGIDSGRFSTPDPPMTVVALVGGVAAAISAGLQLSAEPTGPFAMLGSDSAGLPARAATVLLHGLGLTFKEAQAIARRPLATVTAQLIDRKSQ